MRVYVFAVIAAMVVLRASQTKQPECLIVTVGASNAFGTIQFLYTPCGDTRGNREVADFRGTGSPPGPNKLLNIKNQTNVQISYYPGLPQGNRELLNSFNVSGDVGIACWHHSDDHKGCSCNGAGCPS